MTIKKLKELVGADAVEKLVRDTAARVAREGDWEKLAELVQLAKENGLNVKPVVNKSNNETSEDSLWLKVCNKQNEVMEKQREQMNQIAERRGRAG
jgi:hypothetical protein